MTDFLLLERLHEMMREIPKPRLMHKKGVEVKGFFRPYMSFADYTEAEIFKGYDEITALEGRFSAMLGDGGTADTVRSIKGFAVKFLCDEGDYDLICHNLPVCFFNKAEKFLQLKEALSVNAGFDRLNSKKFWRYVVDNPEAINCAMRFYSYQGLSDSYVDDNWYSVNTYVWKNKKGNKFLVRYKWVPDSEEERKFTGESRKMDRIFAEFIAGFDPDRAAEELRRDIKESRLPSFELQVQMIDHKYITHPHYLKRTLCWNEGVHKPIAIGKMKLTEIIKKQDIAFYPGNTIKGVELCNDDFSMIMNHAHKTGAAERGAKR